MPSQPRWKVAVSWHSDWVIRPFVSCGGKLDEPSLICRAMYLCDLNGPFFGCLDRYVNVLFEDVERKDIQAFTDRYIHADFPRRMRAMAQKEPAADRIRAHIGYTDRCGFYVAFHTESADWSKDPLVEDLRKRLVEIGCKRLDIFS